jgi:hypothetical protein
VLPFAVITLLSGDSVIQSGLTDIDGQYRSLVPVKDRLTLKVSYVGYETLEMRDIKLEKDEPEVTLKLKTIPASVGFIIQHIEPSYNDQLDGTGQTIRGEEYRRMPH